MSIRFIAGWTILAAAAIAFAQPAEKPLGTPISTGGGIEVYLKADFEAENPFKSAGSGQAQVDESADNAAAGKCLHLTRQVAEGYFGASTATSVAGSKDLKIAMLVRTDGAKSLSVNFRDTVKDDNTTPRTKPQPPEGDWTPVVMPVWDFRYNGGPAEETLAADTKFISLSIFAVGAEDVGRGMWIDNVVIYRGADTQPPGPPKSLRIKPGEAGQIELTWSPPDDNALPAVYCIYRRVGPQWQKVGETCRTRFVDVAPAPGLHNYRVTACDYEDNCSRPAMAAPVSVATAGKVDRNVPEVVKDRIVYANTVRNILRAGQKKNTPETYLYFGGQYATPWTFHRTLQGRLCRGVAILDAHSGKDTEFARTQIAQTLATHKPRFAIVLFGDRDPRDVESMGAAMRNLSLVIDACVKNGTVPVLMTLPPEGGDPDQKAVKPFNEAVAKLGRLKKVPVCYSFEEMMTAPGPGKVMNADGYSLSPEGVEAAGRALRKTFDQIFWVARDTGASLQ